VVGQKNIHFPLSRDEALSLTVGDAVLVSGQIITARDKAHQFLFNERPVPSSLPFDLNGSLIYHCGPIVKKTDNDFKIIACGPTTSARVEMYEWWVIEHFGVRAIMGKGGMGSKTLEALKKCGAVYLSTIGGAASVLAEKTKRIVDVFKLDEFGIPEAMWAMEVENFPAIVTMDAHGNSMHDTVKEESEKVYKELLGP
jgi:tartrate/fumarate subfamily iron-sulfur-dependent hydro-lyase beta chain